MDNKERNSKGELSFLPSTEDLDRLKADVEEQITRFRYVSFNFIGENSLQIVILICQNKFV